MSDVKTFEMPVFKFNKQDAISVDDLAKAKKEVEEGGKKRLEAGNHDLKVTKVHAHSQNTTDPTWYSYKVTLADNQDREINHFLMVPTKSPRFQKEGSKQPLFLFIKLVEFVNALGLELPPNDLSILGKLFGEEKIVGKTLNVDIGFGGDHIKRLEDKVYALVDKNDQALRNEAGETLTYVDMDSARGDAANMDIKLTFLSVLKFHQPKKAESKGWDDEELDD